MDAILAIDDDPETLKMLRTILEEAPYRFFAATNGAEGIKLYRQHMPHLVLVDIFMPDMDGLETLREIRKVDAKARVIAISGGDERSRADFLKIAEKFGALDSLMKPIRRNALLAAIERALARTL